MSKNLQISRPKSILLLACVIAFGGHAYASPQGGDVSWQLSQVKEKLTTAISEKKSEWKHSSVTPMQGSQNTVIEQWSGEGFVVRVSVVEYVSEGEATEVLQRLAAEGGGKVKRQHFGDASYSWNDRGSIVFREGRLLVYVGAVSTKVDDPSVLAESGGEAKATKEFARYVADALDDSK